MPARPREDGDGHPFDAGYADDCFTFAQHRASMHAIRLAAAALAVLLTACATPEPAPPATAEVVQLRLSGAPSHPRVRLVHCTSPSSGTVLGQAGGPDPGPSLGMMGHLADDRLKPIERAAPMARTMHLQLQGLRPDTDTVSCQVAFKFTPSGERQYEVIYGASADHRQCYVGLLRLEQASDGLRRVQEHTLETAQACLR